MDSSRIGKLPSKAPFSGLALKPPKAAAVVVVEASVTVGFLESPLPLPLLLLPLPTEPMRLMSLWRPGTVSRTWNECEYGKTC